jgi:hypothetical protein
MAVGKEPLADEARLKIAAGANSQNTLCKRLFKTLDHVLLGAFGVNLQKIGNNAKTGENLISTFGLDFQDFLNFRLARFEVAEAFRSEIGLETGTEATVLQEVEITLAALFVESSF